VIFKTALLVPEFFREIAMFYLTKKKSFFQLFFLRILIAFYGARVRGSVLKMEFRVLSREFESIETSPGFAQLLGENWV
jgi:hypothetical protein